MPTSKEVAVQNSFRERHREMQEIARELDVLRRHNLQFQEGDSQETLLMIAEAAVICLAMERFLRIILVGEATEADTLPNLLEKATSKRLNLIKLINPDRNEGIRAIVRVRNTLLHGNYEQAAREAGCADRNEYFKTKFASHTETMFRLLDHFMEQIDPETGFSIHQR